MNSPEIRRRLERRLARGFCCLQKSSY
uniref:Uncharacterized protein n=1 Tax=Arundo donax TaxID=35708 RepID=A0A0A9B9I2_ARUDO